MIEQMACETEGKVEEVKPLAAAFPKCEAVDRLFAVFYFLVGYYFVFLSTEWWFERHLAVFTVVYAVVVLWYLREKRVVIPRESWFWLGIMLAMGIPYAFWSVWGILQVLALMVVAAYWTISATGRLLEKNETSKWVFFDTWNALFVVPFCNFSCQTRVLLSCAKDGEESQKKGKFGGVFLGIVIVLPILVIILPLLSSADPGFERMVGSLVSYTEEHLFFVFVRMVFAVPVSFYLFGLVFGGIHGRNTDRFCVSQLQKTEKGMQKVSDTAICTALLVLCLIYVLFVGLQGSYLFSAFVGGLPKEFTYAEYARRGFFELCQIGAWNLVLLWGAKVFAKSGNKEYRGLEMLRMGLSVLTLLLLFTAVSKMGMYISVYGLTVRRILPLVFMLWMGVVFVAVLVKQRKEFRMVRLCVMVGAVMFCALCVVPVEKWVEVYNVWARAKGWIV